MSKLWYVNYILIRLLLFLKCHVLFSNKDFYIRYKNIIVTLTLCQNFGGKFLYAVNITKSNPEAIITAKKRLLVCSSVVGSGVKF